MPKEINLLPQNLRDEEKKILRKDVMSSKDELHQPGFFKRKPSRLQTPPKKSPLKEPFFRRLSKIFKRKPKEKKEEPEIRAAVNILEKIKKQELREPETPNVILKNNVIPKENHIPKKNVILSVAKDLANKASGFSFRSLRSLDPSSRRARHQDDKEPEKTIEKKEVLIKKWHKPLFGLTKITGTDFLSRTLLHGTSDSEEVLIRRRLKYLFLLSILYLMVFTLSWGITWKREKTFIARASQGKSEYDRLTRLVIENEPRFEKALQNALKVELASELLSTRTDWMKIFDFFEKNTVEGVRYVEFRSASERTLSLGVEALSYETFVSQLLVFDRNREIIENYNFGDIRRADTKEKELASQKISVNVTLEFSKKFLE